MPKVCWAFDLDYFKSLGQCWNNWELNNIKPLVYGQSICVPIFLDLNFFQHLKAV